MTSSVCDCSPLPSRKKRQSWWQVRFKPYQGKVTRLYSCSTQTFCWESVLLGSAIKQHSRDIGEGHQGTRRGKTQNTFWSLHVRPVSVWVFSWYSDVHNSPKTCMIRSISVNVCPVLDWWALQYINLYTHISAVASLNIHATTPHKTILFFCDLLVVCWDGWIDKNFIDSLRKFPQGN